ncbi:hypothetical protein F4779DRAFT_622163 [Xylariaceae sp. FL0662B]|nr:hypothetical protein F4779DRAFT_622163 [Xylariaceae sp. FL0662B]
MEAEFYSLADVLAVANTHPFYVSSIKYPPDAQAIHAVRRKTAEQQTEVDLTLQPLLRKKDLYITIDRLIDDASPQNTYRHSIYASVTGGALKSKELFFATDVHENRRNRASFGRFLHMTGIINDGDWVLTVHTAGNLYRSLDLTLEILENAGASVLSAGSHMSPVEVSRLLAVYHVNVLTGDSSQVVQIVHYISTLAQEDRDRIKLDKIIYTSEVLTAAQRTHITTVLGPVKIYSILGSAEAGPWAASNPDVTGKGPVASHADFIFDTRSTLIEILSPSSAEDGPASSPMPDGEQGIIVQTSLTRIRNPVVRYVTGDVGSLHPLPEQARALIPETDWPYLRVLRLRGRDRRFSFEWNGEYIMFEDVAALMEDAECGILQWQVILDKLKASLESSLEIRLLCSPREGHELLSELALVDRLKTFFRVFPEYNHRFQVAFVKGHDGFEQSSTGRKVIKFIDRYN